jgi:aminoglycoside phosphotransferase (APT) family kinase protein
VPPDAYADAAPVPEHVDGESWELGAARWRLDTLRAELPVAVPRDAQFIGGASNDAWQFDDLVLRVCWRGDRGRLAREARVLEVLPEAIPHAPVAGFGRSDDLSWMLSRRVRGRPLDTLADGLTRPVLRGLCEELATILAALHAWSPPPEVAALVGERPELDPADPLSVWAADLVTLPVPRALAITDLAKALPHVDPALIDAAAERIGSLADADALATSREPWVVVHGDANPGNVLVHGSRMSAFLDFEWVRLGPPDLELVSVFRMAKGPPGGSAISRLPILQWLEEDYPSLFGAEDFDRRMWLYELGYWLHALLWWPPDGPERGRVANHPVRALRQLIDAPLPR